MTIWNVGTATLNINSITASAGFAVSSTTCGATLGVYWSCRVNVTFTPTVAGWASGTLSFNDNAGNSPQTVALSGTGTADATLTPTSATYAAQTVGTTSGAQTFTLTNTRYETLAGIGITTAGDFAVSSTTCGKYLWPKAQCTISVTFTPKATGTRTGQLSVSDSASNSPQTAALSGTGTGNATLAPATATYAAQTVGTTSAAQNFTLTNNQPATLTSLAVATTGDFAVSSTTCGTSLAANSSCVINVTFTPTATGTRTGQLSVSDSASNSPQTAALSGTGIGNATLAPATATYAAQTVGTTSAAQNFTLTNNQPATLTSLAVATTGDFAVSSTTCGTSLAANSSCVINVTFTPTATGTRTGQLSVSDSASNSPQTAALSGTGIVNATPTLTPASATYTGQKVGTTSAAQTFTLANPQSVALTSIAVATTGDFAVSSTTCGTSLAANSSCVINVTFTPTATGTRTGQLSVSDSASNSPQTASLTGTGQSSTSSTVTLVHHSESISCADATTCSVALSGPVSQGNFLVITASAINPVHMVSIGSGGTFVDGNVRNGTTLAGGYLSGGYVSSATATSGPIVVTFSGTTGGTQVNIREYAVSGGGTLAPDATGDNLSDPTPNTFTTPTLTLTGTNDLIVSWAGANTGIGSVAPPYGNADIAGDETGSGTADLLNTSAGTGATWSANSGVTASASASLAFGFQPQTCDNMALMDSSGGVAGNTITPAALAASTQGAVDTGVTGDNWNWRVPTASAFSWSAAAHKPLVNKLRFCDGGATYVDGSSLGVQYNTSAGSGQYLQMLFPGTWDETYPFVSNTASAGIWFSTSLPQNAVVNADIFTLFGSNGGYINVILSGNGTNLFLSCEIESANCTTSSPVIQSNTWYWITLQYNSAGGANYGALYDSSLNLLNTFSGTNPAESLPGYVLFGDTNNTSTLPPNAVMQFDKLKVCYIGNCYFPVMP